EVVLPVERVGGVVADPGVVPTSADNDRAASVSEVAAFPVQEWPGNLLRTTHRHMVGAVFAATAEAEGDEQVVVAVLSEDEGSLDGAAARAPVGGGPGAVPGGDRIPLLRFRDAKHVVRQPDQLQPGPERAERHPRNSVVIVGDVGIDRVP